LCHRVCSKGVRRICTASRSAAPRAPEAAAELASAGESLALVVWEAPRRERQKDESDGRRRSLGGRRRRRTQGFLLPPMLLEVVR